MPTERHIRLSLHGWDDDGEQVAMLELPDGQCIKGDKCVWLYGALQSLVRAIMDYIEEADNKLGINIGPYERRHKSWISLERAAYVYSRNIEGLKRLEAINQLPKNWRERMQHD